MKDRHPAVFLDRDGTINVDKHYLYRIEDFEYIDGVIDALRIFRDKGYLLVIITNQSGIARGYYTEEDFAILNDWMVSDLKRQGIEIAGVYYCPHLPGVKNEHYGIECECRKPRTGLFWKAQKELNIDMNCSLAVGDKERDLCISHESNVRGYLVGEKRLLDIANEAVDYTNR